MFDGNAYLKVGCQSMNAEVWMPKYKGQPDSLSLSLYLSVHPPPVCVSDYTIFTIKLFKKIMYLLGVEHLLDEYQCLWLEPKSW